MVDKAGYTNEKYTKAKVNKSDGQTVAIILIIQNVT